VSGMGKRKRGGRGMRAARCGRCGALATGLDKGAACASCDDQMSFEKLGRSKGKFVSIGWPASRTTAGGAL
jgi:hypothetical protein